MTKLVKGLLIAGGVLTVVGGITSAVAFGMAYQRGEALSTVLRRTVDFQESYGTAGVRSLDIEMGIGELEIVHGSEFSVRAEGVSDHFQSVMDGDTWKLFQEEEHTLLSLGSASYPKITVTVPEECVLDSLSLDVGVGQLCTETLTTGTLAIECGTGEVSFCGRVCGDVDIDCGVGSVNLALYNEEGEFSGTVSCGVGEVSVGSQHFSHLGAAASFGSGQGEQMKIDCGVGAVKVEFRGEESMHHESEHEVTGSESVHHESEYEVTGSESVHHESEHEAAEPEMVPHEEEGGEIHGA